QDCIEEIPKIDISTLHFSCTLEAKSNGILSTASLPRRFTIRLWREKHEKQARFGPAAKGYRDDGVCALQRARFFYAASRRGASGGRQRQLCASQRNK